MQLGRRGSDDSQDFTRRGLLLQSFGQFTVARLLLINQPSILNRDDRLVGEGFEQFDVTICKRPNLRAANMNDANNVSFM